jgi:hypothetical protein
MMKNNTHQVADFDSIVEDGTSLQILASADLVPSSWNFPDLEVERILGSGLRIKIKEKLADKNWPACVNRDEKIVNVAPDFLELENFTQEEKLATIVHEIGHIVNPEPEGLQITDKTQDDRIADYLGALKEQDKPSDTPAGISELYADDYVRHCDLTDSLRVALQRLCEEYPNYFENQVTRDRLTRIDSGCAPVLAWHAD